MMPIAKTLKRHARKMPNTKPKDGLELCWPACCCCDAEAVPNPADDAEEEDASVAAPEGIVTSVPGAADANAML